ncbi:hypothetical protein AUW26_31570 [Streptomyces sp. CC71]|nr:hypothetical protein AUW26_31570 [Streptomyces sp. CC71]
MGVRGAQPDDRVNVQPEGCRVDHGPVAGDDAVLLEPLDARTGRGLRKTDAAPHLRAGQPAVALEQSEDVSVYLVECCLVE